jgi:hypothetical protein
MEVELCVFLTGTPNVVEWSVSRWCCLYPCSSASSAHCLGGWKGSELIQDSVALNATVDWVAVLFRGSQVRVSVQIHAIRSETFVVFLKSSRKILESIYIKAKRADFVCVLLGDGSGGVFFLVSSRSICLLVTTTMGWCFLWGPFRGYISLLACSTIN